MHKPPSRWPVVLIALDKLMKAVGLVVVSFVLRGLPLHRDEWVELVTQGHIIHPLRQLLLHALAAPQKNINTIHVIVIILAGLYLIEGVGLIWDLKWAEWLVVISTASFIPFEIFEIVREDTLLKWIVLFLNIVIFVYLAFRLYRLAQVKPRARSRRLTGHAKIQIKLKFCLTGRAPTPHRKSANSQLQTSPGRLVRMPVRLIRY